MRLAIFSCVSAVLLFSAACTTTADPTESATDQVVAGGTEDPITIACKAPGAKVAFHADLSTHEISKAVYTETTSGGQSRVVTEMGVCREIPLEGPVVPDMLVHTHHCNDVLFVDGYNVELFQGGIAGMPDITLTKVNGANPGVVDKPFVCRYTAAASCRTEKISFKMTQGCMNDGSVEFCVPKGDLDLQKRIKDLDSDVNFIRAGGRARCNLDTELLGMLPTKVGTDCVAQHGAMKADAWETVCAIASESKIRKIVPTFFE